MTTEADADIRRKETADWFARLNQRKVTTADVKAFSAWRRDPENAQAFDRMQAMWDATRTLADQPEMAALSQDARTRSATRKGRKRLLGVLSPVGAVGAIVVALSAGWWLWSSQQPAAYLTDIGERRVVQLEDGSRVTLDTGSKIDVRLTDGRRLVSLVDGQARFDVAGDPARPFIVRAGDTEVTALGTSFDVRRFGSGARVVLVEGRVDVRTSARPERQWSLRPGQQLVTSAREPEIATTDLPAATSWTTGRLTFHETPIGVAVAEVNRYTRHPIELRAGDISTIRVSGVFDAGDVDGFVAALRDLYALDAERADDGRIILSGASKNNLPPDLG
ncbi:FecR domain-containing protein [Brevundimonas sp.]|uniref:FecR family protein n=1 Tax=Brevundimonas sp. TaxID=1871086 RepID=UPI0035B059AD